MAHPDTLNDTPGKARHCHPKARNPTTPGDLPPFDETSASARVSTDPAQLPYYAARSLLRMFAALGLSLLLRRARKTPAVHGAGTELKRG